MIVSPRISKAALAQLCRRLATQVEAGIEIRTICRREAERVSGWSHHRVFSRISDAVNRGESLSDAFNATGDFFPLLFRQIVRVGEQSGKLPEAFRLLAQYYEEDLHRRRTFWMLLAWPLFELTLAILVIGFLIWIMGAISARAGMTIDPLGFGLIGNPRFSDLRCFRGNVHRSDSHLHLGHPPRNVMDASCGTVCRCIADPRTNPPNSCASKNDLGAIHRHAVHTGHSLGCRFGPSECKSSGIHVSSTTDLAIPPGREVALSQFRRNGAVFPTIGWTPCVSVRKAAS
jgi:hypothetical protein